MMPGLVIDDSQADVKGDWKSGEGLKNYIGDHYLYLGGKARGSVAFEWTPEETGVFDVRVSHQPHPNRSSRTKVQLHAADGVKDHLVNQQEEPKLPGGFVSLGEHYFRKGVKASVVILTDGADGNVHADAVQIIKP